MIVRHFVLVAAALSAVSAAAHEARPVFVQLLQRADGSVDAEWRVPSVRSVPANPKVELSEHYELVGNVSRADYGSSTRYRARYSGSVVLAGQTIAIRYPTLNPSLSTLIRVTLSDGTVHSKLLAPDELEWRIPEAPTRSGVLTDYTALGIRHIFEGIDHLLFVACLVLLAGTFRRTLVTITGFTIAHSITLALATLDVVHVPGPPVEAVIALSVLFCARELALPERDSIMRRYPVAVSSSFGLLHGFGFASALRETGLPQGEIPTALLSFNIGVELGQIAFVTGIWLVLRLARTQSRRTSEQQLSLRQPAVYIVGSLAAFWTVSRIFSF